MLLIKIYRTSLLLCLLWEAVWAVLLEQAGRYALEMVHHLQCLAAGSMGCAGLAWLEPGSPPQLQRLLLVLSSLASLASSPLKLRKRKLTLVELLVLPLKYLIDVIISGTDAAESG